MHFNQPPHHREADAKAALLAIQRPFHLREQIEDPQQHVARDADARVGHANHRVRRAGLHLHADFTTVVGVLRGVVNEIAGNLRESGDIAVHVDWRVR